MVGLMGVKQGECFPDFQFLIFGQPFHFPLVYIGVSQLLFLAGGLAKHFKQSINYVMNNDNLLIDNNLQFQLMDEKGSSGSDWGSEDDFWSDDEEFYGDERKDVAGDERMHIMQIVKTYYGIKEEQILSLSKLGGYVTKNYKISLKEKGQFVLKIYKNVKNLIQHSQILNHILLRLSKSQFCHYPIPIQTSQEEYVRVTYDSFWKQQVMIRMLSYADGVTWRNYIERFKHNQKNNNDQKRYVGDLMEVVRMLAICGRHLEAYYEENLSNKSKYKVLHRRNYEWIIEHSQKWGTNINKDVIPDPKQMQILLQAKTSFDAMLEKNGKKLKKTLIHNDPNEDNIIVKQTPNQPLQIMLIDFDDCLVCYKVGDLAIAIVHLLTSPLQDIYKNTLLSLPEKQQKFMNQFVLKFITTYHNENSLSETDAQCLFFFVCARLALLFVNVNKDMKKVEAYDNLDVECKEHFFYLQKMLEIGAQRFCHAVKRVLGMLVEEQM